jgi:DNA-binding CsgD family transcriptional regulator
VINVYRLPVNSFRLCARIFTLDWYLACTSRDVATHAVLEVNSIKNRSFARFRDETGHTRSSSEAVPTPVPQSSLGRSTCNVFTEQYQYLRTKSVRPTRTKNCEAILLRKQKRSMPIPCQQTQLLPKSYVLCERSSGAVRFRVDAESDGSMPVDKIAGLLAVHCLMRGQAPEDFDLMVMMEESLLHAVAGRAKQLLSAGRALGAGIRVSRREQEVLNGLLQSLANKEIASKLNVSVRTVKFHVSSLLAKFGVTDRVALTREVSLSRGPAHLPASQSQPQTLFGYSVRDQESNGQTDDAPEPRPVSAEGPRSRARALALISNPRYAN